MALPLPPNYNQPIPNSSFYYPNEEALASSTGPLIVGAGLAVDYANGQLQAAGGGLANVSATLPLYKTGTVSNPVINIEVANKLRLGAVQVGTNLTITGVGVINVLDATVTNKGAVQLADTTASTSKFLALTANQGYLLQQQISSLVISSDLILAGTFNPVTAQMTKVTTKGQEAGFVLNNNLPLPGPENEGYFVILSERGIYTPPGSGTAIDGHVGSWFLSTGTEWNYLKISEQVPSATETSGGIIRLATTQEAIDGTNDTAAMTSLKVAEVTPALKTLTAKGDIYVATGAGAATALPAGTDNQVLTACSVCPEGIYWSDAAEDIPCSVVTGCGAMIVGDAAGAPATHALGANNQYLRVNYNCPNGIEWVTVTNNFAIPCATLQNTGDLITASAANTPVALPRGTCGQLLAVNPSCTTTGGLTWCDYQAPIFTALKSSPVGSLISTDGAENVIFSAGAALPGAVICYTGAGLAGLCYENNPPWIRCDLIESSVGALAVGNGTNVIALPASTTNGQVLTTNTACSTGLEWANPQTCVVNADITGGTCTLDQGNFACFTLLPVSQYAPGCWQINIWGWTCSSTSGKGYMYVAPSCGAVFGQSSPLQQWWHPNTESRMGTSLTWAIDNTGASWNPRLYVKSDNNREFTYEMFMSAQRVG
jgi:hypothetical protein